MVQSGNPRLKQVCRSLLTSPVLSRSSAVLHRPDEETLPETNGMATEAVKSQMGRWERTGAEEELGAT